jgi:hypothetical protein
MRPHSKVKLLAMFVERNFRYSALFTNLVGWHAGAVSFPLSDIILTQLACPLSDVMLCLHSGITNLSLYKHWLLALPTNGELGWKWPVVTNTLAYSNTVLFTSVKRFVICSPGLTMKR